MNGKITTTSVASFADTVSVENTGSVGQPEDTDNTDKPARSRKNDKVHLVEKGETVYGISKHYGITQNELIEDVGFGYAKFFRYTIYGFFRLYFAVKVFFSVYGFGG